MSGIVIVGGGQAGASAADKLRALGYDGALTVVCGEDAPPYQRPPLSKKYLLGEMARERLFLKPEAHYADKNINLFKGQPATAIDREARTVTVGGERIGYDTLILTTGAVPRTLPKSLSGGRAGIHTVRTLACIDALAPEMTEGRRLLVIGGGYIGLEAAAVARRLGLDVTVAEQAPRILCRVAARETADWFRQLHESEGVTFRENAQITEFVGDDRVTAVRFADATELPVDLVIAGIGIEPDIGLAEAAGLDLQNGIATDEMGRTSDPNIWSAGDCASFPWKGGRLRLESVQNAIDMAECVAENIMGAGKPYVPMPWFWSDQYDTQLQIAGLHTGHTHVAVRPGSREGGRSHWYFDEAGTLLAVDAINDARAYMVGKRLIENGKSPSAAELESPETDLKALLKL